MKVVCDMNKTEKNVTNKGKQKQFQLKHLITKTYLSSRSV